MSNDCKVTNMSLDEKFEKINRGELRDVSINAEDFEKVLYTLYGLLTPIPNFKRKFRAVLEHNPGNVVVKVFVEYLD